MGIDNLSPLLRSKRDKKNNINECANENAAIDASALLMALLKAIGWVFIYFHQIFFRLGGGPMVNLTLSYSNGLLFIVFMHVNGLYQHSMHINSYHMALPIYSSILPRSFAIP